MKRSIHQREYNSEDVTTQIMGMSNSIRIEYSS